MAVQVTYVPKPREIATITQGDITTVVTTSAHEYHEAQVVTFFVPIEFKMYEMNKVQAKVTIVDDYTFTVPIDSRQFNPFVIPNFPPAYTPAQVLPVTGEGYNTFSMPATVAVFPPIRNGSFENLNYHP